MPTTIDGGVACNHLVGGGADNSSLVVAGLRTKKTKIGGRGGWVDDNGGVVWQLGG